MGKRRGCWRCRIVDRRCRGESALTASRALRHILSSHVGCVAVSESCSSKCVCCRQHAWTAVSSFHVILPCIYIELTFSTLCVGVHGTLLKHGFATSGVSNLRDLVDETQLRVSSKPSTLQNLVLELERGHYTSLARRTRGASLE